jgi:sulfate/thiosulfate transport system substrate-binding protein
MNLRRRRETNSDILFRIRATKRNEFPAPKQSAGQQCFPLGRVAIGSAQRKLGRIMPTGFNSRLLAALIFAFAAFPAVRSHAETVLLNVSYDPTRELFREFDRAFAEKWRADTGEEIEILASHGGSGKQARAVIDGLDADVVTLALESDINAIVKKSGKIKPGWRSRLPHNSTPYTSTIVFVVRKGNPKAVHDWADLAAEGIGVVTTNPKTSGGARWNYLAAWAWAHHEFGGDETRIKAFIAALYGNVSVLDAGARASATTFAQREIGDVLISWENEAYLLQKAFPDAGLEIVLPSISILAEPPVAVVDANVDAHGTRKAAEAYLQFLYSKQGQNIIASHNFRPALPELVDAKPLPALNLVTIDDPMFGGWAKAQPYHFGPDGIFDQIYAPGG